ncbi:MFS transporter [Paenibacillus crassostreae]|uniref:MFS transporter n=1 Tax=Paenibacillus crassostreae TaxID=1763538 RepID=UPI003AB007C5
MKIMSDHWKYSSMLLFGIGVSNVGSWIYFIALNLIVLHMTQSPLAVSVLYILKPLATIFTNVWSGSLIDRLNKRNLMVILDILRAILITLLPLFSSVGYIYMLVFLINMVGSMFGPTSMSYITQLIPTEQRPRFNSLNSLIGSGAFLLGPAVAGILFLVGSPIFAIYINAIALLISGIITWLMPDLDRQSMNESLKVQEQRGTMTVLKDDWNTVLQFYRRNISIMVICFLFGSVFVVMASAVDSLEASFATLVLHMTDGEYGILVSIAGAGIIVGAIMNTLFINKMDGLWMIGLGALGVCLGYVIYAFSSSFLIAAIGFLVLACCLAFVNTGFATFYQNHIPVDVMGRVGSINAFIEAIFMMVATVALGIAAEIISLRLSVIAGVLVMVLLGISLLVYVMKEPFKGNLGRITEDITMHIS